MNNNVIDICTGSGLFARAFLDNGFNVTAGCEINPQMREMHKELCGDDPICHDIGDLPNHIEKGQFFGLIGGPPCQALSKTKNLHTPKFPDKTPEVIKVLEKLQPTWFLLENVAPLPIPGAVHTKLDAMHFGNPHQSRPRWFTHSPNLIIPRKIYPGTVDSLMAYPIVAGRIYGPKRGAILQGYPEFSSMDFPCTWLQLGLANAVHYGVGSAWARSIRTTFGK